MILVLHCNFRCLRFFLTHPVLQLCLIWTAPHFLCKTSTGRVLLNLLIRFRLARPIRHRSQQVQMLPSRPQEAHMNQTFYRNLATRPSNHRPFWTHQFHLVFFYHSTQALLVKTWTICGFSFAMDYSNLLADVLGLFARILRISTRLFISVLMDPRYERQHIESSHFNVPKRFSYTPLYRVDNLLSYYLPRSGSPFYDARLLCMAC